jgi:hypothetical protein
MRDGKEVMARPGQKAGSFTYSSFSRPEIGTGLASVKGRTMIRQDRFTVKNTGKSLPSRNSVRGEICEAVFCHDRTQLYMINVVVASPANGDHDGTGHRGRECRLFLKA